jgi:hypothetical protein
MKKFLALAAIVTLVACEKKAETPPAADSGAMMTPAPADTSSMMMQHDSMAPADSMMPRDTTRQM